MENAVLERISARQFVATLTPDETVCVFALMLGYTQEQVAVLFGSSAATINRLVMKVRHKYTVWNS